MKRYVFLADLKNETETINRYKKCHENIPQEVLNHLPQNGVVHMEIYHLGNRLVNIMDVDESYTGENLVCRVNVHPAVEAWDQLTTDMMQPLPFEGCGQKWELAEMLYSRNNHIL
ncbi:MAG: L-rhamnose mutarotase [Ruthenibacterium sp.]